MTSVTEKKSFNYKYDGVEEQPSKGFGIGIRHLQAFLMFLCVVFAYGIRVCLSIAIVAMTTKSSENAEIMYYPDWDKKVQNLLLSSFFFGYLVTQLPAGVLSTKYGGKNFLAMALLTNGVLSLLIPWAVNMGSWKALMVIRIMQGFGQGFVFPCLSTLLGKWAPLDERSRLTNCVYCASPFGTVFTMPISGYIAASSYGWPAVFYFFGVVSTLCGVVYFLFGSDSPATDKYISEEEKNYIEESLGNVEIVQDKKSIITPYKAIFTSIPLLALNVAHTGGTYGFLTFLLEIPSYMNEVFKVNMKSSGWLSSLPYIGATIFSLLSSVAADALVNKKIMSLTDVRKLANTLATFCPAVGIVIMCMVPSDQMYLAVTTVVVTTFFSGANNVGYVINHIDLSPNFSGIMFGITNMTANIFGLIAPNIVGFIVTDPLNPSQWNTVFYIVAGVYLGSGIIYLIFGSAEKQDWNELVYREDLRNEIKLTSIVLSDKQKNTSS